LYVTYATIHEIHCEGHGRGPRVDINTGNGSHLFDFFVPEDIFIIDQFGGDPILIEENEWWCGD
jgi:hypothetical protein